MAYGQAGHLAVTFQESFGTSQTNSGMFIPLVSESVTETINQLTEENLYGLLAEPPTHEGTHAVQGDIRTEAHPIALGTLLKAALGRVTTTAQGSAFLHEFLPAMADWDAYAATPPMTLELHRDVGSAFVYYDMLGSALTLEIAQGQLLTSALSLLGGGTSRKAAATPAFHRGRPWSWDVASAAYDSAGITDLRQMSLVFDNRLSPHYTLSGTRRPRRIKRDGPQTVSVEGSMLFEDQALFQEFLDQSEKPLRVSFAGETVADSYRALLTLDLPRFRLTEFTPQLAGAGQIEVSFAGKGVYDQTSGYALRFTLTNTQAQY